MKNILNLIKINFISLFKNMFGINKRKKATGFLGTAILLLVVMYLAFGSTMNSFAMILSEVGYMDYLLFMGAILSFAFVLFFITYEVQSYFFKTKDFELLSSLPIKNSHIVIAKYTSVLLSAYLYSSFILFPTFVVYFMYVPFNFGLLLLFLLGFLFFPLVPMALGTLFGLIISLITSKLKFSNVISIILFVLIFVLYFVLYFYMNNFVSSITQGGQNLLNSLQYYLPSVVWFFTGFVQGNVLYIFLDVILALAVSGITITLLSLLYKKINFNLLKVAKPKVKGEISFKKKSVSASLLKIEAKRFLSYPSYVLNSCFGLIFMLVIPFFFKFAVFSGEGMEEIALELATIIPIITICINAMLAGMTNTTASSISLEGKQIALLKSLPIKPSKIYFNKILFNNLLAIPVIIVSNIINLILFFEYFNVFSGIFLFLVPILAVLSVSTFGILINLLMPKFNFENVNQVIKQSVCVLIILLLAMVLGIVPMIISFYIPALNLNLFLIIYALLYLILFIVSIAILKIKGEKLYSKLKI